MSLWSVSHTRGSPHISDLEILHPSEYFRLEGACSHVRYYLLGQLDSNKMLGSVVTKKYTIMEMYNQISDHFIKLTGTSMMNLVVKLVSSSRFNSSDKYCSKGIIELREIKQKYIQRKLLFPEILYVAIYLMMLKAECVVKVKITLMSKGLKLTQSSQMIQLQTWCPIVTLTVTMMKRRI